jgi:hypothetical protein
MSAVASSLGSTFITETAHGSSALPGAFITESVFALTPVDLAGDLAPVVSFIADMTVVPAVINYVDLAGNIGGVSLYGRGKWGVGKYSRNGAMTPVFAADVTVGSTQDLAGDLSPSVTLAGSILVDAANLAGGLAPSVAFAGSLDLVGTVDFNGALAPVVTFGGALTALTGLAGDLAPSITFGGDLTLAVPTLIDGDLAPQVTFAADLTLTVSLAGDLAPQIDLGATLTGLVTMAGDLSVQVALAAPGLMAGPLWAPSTPCSSPPWSPTDPCPPPLWTPEEPCDAVDWEETELCNG